MDYTFVKVNVVYWLLVAMSWYKRPLVLFSSVITTIDIFIACIILLF